MTKHEERHHHLFEPDSSFNDASLDADSTCVIDQAAVLRALRESMPNHGIGLPHRGTGSMHVADASLVTTSFDAISDADAAEVLWHTQSEEPVELPTRSGYGAFGFVLSLASIVTLGAVCGWTL